MKSLFRGRVFVTTYGFNTSYGKITKDRICVEQPIFYETDLDIPPMNAGEHFYIGKMNLVVYLRGSMRGKNEADNEEIRIYDTDYILSDTVDENSYEPAKKRHDEFFEAQELRKKAKEEAERKWWQVWKKSK